MANAWSRANRLGLMMTLALGAASIIFGLTRLPTIMNGTPPGQEFPMSGVLLLDLILGVVMLVAAGLAWTAVSRTGATIASVANILQALTATPAFLVGAPVGWQVVAGAVLIWTTVSVGLTLSRSKVMNED